MRKYYYENVAANENITAKTKFRLWLYSIFYRKKKTERNTLIFLFIHGSILSRVANSMVEYSAFNRIVLGSSPRQPNFMLLNILFFT